MTDDARKRFEDKLDESLKVENVAGGPFAQAYEANKKAWITQQISNVEGGQVDITALRQQFNDAWSNQIVPQIKDATLAAYDGKPAQEASSPAPEIDTDGLTDKLMAGASAGLLAGDFFGGLKHTAATAGLGFLSGLPIVGKIMSGIGKLFTQAVTYIDGKLGGESLSWQEAGEVTDRNARKKRLGTMQGVDTEKLNQMVDEAAHDPAPEEQADQDRQQAGQERQAAAQRAADAERNAGATVPGTGAEDATPDDHQTPPPTSTQTADPAVMQSEQSAGRTH